MISDYSNDNRVFFNQPCEKNPGCLIIRAMRQWFDCRRNWHLISAEFQMMLGHKLGLALTSRLEEMLVDIEKYTFRPLRIQAIGASEFGLDELLIHQGIAAIQAARFLKADYLIEEIVQPAGHGAIADGMFTIARYLSVAGHQLVLVEDNVSNFPQEQLLAAE